MLQEYVLNVSSIFSLKLQQVFSCCKLQVFYVDVAYVALVIYVYCKCIVLIVSDALDVC
jgi:hypothetical protein